MSLRAYFNQNWERPALRCIPFLVIIFFLVQILCHSSAVFLTQSLTDPDDYMRLNEVINWLSGQSWFDLSQPRLSPGKETIIHWARLVDLPLAFVMHPLITPLGMQKAAIVAACVVPPLLFFSLIVLIPALARPLVGRRGAALALLMVIFAPNILFNYLPGRVDHHGYSILIAGFGLLALQHMLLLKRGWLIGIVAGVLFACGLWIGTEIVPSLALTLLCLLYVGAWRGDFVARNAAFFGISLFASSLIILPLALPVSEWGSRAVSWFSPAAVLGCGCSAVVFLVVWGIAATVARPFLRVSLTIFVAFGAIALFVMYVPEVLEGPFADYDPFNATRALEDITEATPLSKIFAVTSGNHLSYLAALAGFFRDIFVSLSAIFVSLYGVWSSRSRARILWSFSLIFVTGMFLLAFFGQSRLTWFLNLYRLAPLAYLIWGFWKRLKPSWSLGVRLAVGILMVIFLGVVPLSVPRLLAAPIVDLMVPSSEGRACTLYPTAAFLMEPQGYGKDQHTILAPLDEGPELLFRTRHNVIGANFDVPGNQDVFDFFSARDDDKALSILRRWHVDLVLACRNIPHFYTGREHIKFGQNAFLHLEKDGKLHLVSSLSHPTLTERLLEGTPPPWLKPVEIAGNKDYLVYAVMTDQKMETLQK